MALGGRARAGGYVPRCSFGSAKRAGALVHSWLDSSVAAAPGPPVAKVLAWDAKAMRFTNDDAANTLVDTPYRKEWDYQV